MEKIFKSRLVSCVLILVLASSIFVFGGLDVVVREGKVLPDSRVGDYGNMPDAYINFLYVEDNASFYNSLVAGDSISANNAVNCYKLNAQVIDPAGVLYDLQTRQQIIDVIKKTIAPDKQGGALVFFNKDTKGLETYVPGEGKFYDIQGNLLYTMPKLEVATDYKTIYHLDIMTGEVKTRQEVLFDKYIIKKGFRLDPETGHFINTASGEIVPKETAIELMKAS
ncbi:MAG: hypothetical protein WBC22_11195 [Sedimentisphaerales bacterium]